jgi:hypothetical protein
MARAIMRPMAGQGMSRENRAAAEALIKPNARLTSFERLEIYNRQYWFRVLDCLYDDFPGVRALLGGRRFQRLATAYLARHPSTSFTLRNLGRHLPKFMQAENCPVVAVQMARLEWAHIEAFDNASRPTLTAEDLAGRAPGQIRLRLQPYITLLRLDYPLDSYLIALRGLDRFRGEASNAVEDSTGTRRQRHPARPPREPIWLAAHRHRNVVHYKRLSRAQFKVLTMLASGKSLGAALGGAGAKAPVQEWFQDWAALGWFSLR